jgi:hypothetical protein
VLSAHSHALAVTGIFAADVIITVIILGARWRADRRREAEEQPPQHDGTAAEAPERLAA